MIKDLIKLSNHLDAKGLTKEADYLDAVIRKISAEEDDEEKEPMTHLLESELFQSNSPAKQDDLEDAAQAINWDAIKVNRGKDPNDPLSEFPKMDVSRLLWDYADNDNSGAIDPGEYGDRVFDVIKRIIKELNPDVTDEQLESAVKTELENRLMHNKLEN